LFISQILKVTNESANKLFHDEKYLQELVCEQRNNMPVENIVSLYNISRTRCNPRICTTPLEQSYHRVSSKCQVL